MTHDMTPDDWEALWQAQREAPVSDRLDDLPDNVLPFPAGPVAGTGEEGSGPRVYTAGRSDAVKPFVLVRASDMAARAPTFLIRDVMETSSLACIFGDPGCGKSFMSLHMACCVATGTPFFGLPVKQGVVIYLAGEGHGGLARRVSAWEAETGASMTDAPLFISAVAPRLLDDAHTEAVATAVADVAGSEGAPCLIVVDTLARSFVGGDENSSQDMGRFIAALDAMKNVYPGCTVLVVHHTGHADKGRARGSMALLGSMDAEYICRKEGDAITLGNTKMKDAATFSPKGFALKSVTLGVDDEGREYGSAVLVASDVVTKASKKKPASGKYAVALQALSEALIEDGRIISGPNYPNRPVVSMSKWRDMCRRHGISNTDTDEAAKKAFQRSKDKLVEDGFVRQFDDFVWKVGDDAE